MIEEIFGEGDKKLIELSLTHPSYTKETSPNSLENYERLEFFGDSVLKLFTSKLLYQCYPNYSEGELSKIRSILVSDAILAKVAIQIGVPEKMKLGRAEEKQGGRNRESNIACSLEALLGAYYLSGQEKKIEEFIKNYIMVFAEDINLHFAKYNAKDILQQYTQSINKTLPEYKTIAVKGPAHAPIFEVEVCWSEKILATGSGKSKKEAQQNCAYEACKNLEII